MSRFQLIVYGAIGVIVLGLLLVLTGVIPGLRNRGPEPFTLMVWGVGDDTLAWERLGDTYRKTVLEAATIRYERKNPATYETELVNTLASGQSPDIFVLEDAWLEKHRDKIKPLPSGTQGYLRETIKTTFPDSVAGAIVTDTGELLGTPLVFDTLALFYNRDYLNSANFPNPPRTWEELLAQVKILTTYTEGGTIKRSGIALGTASNVENAADILLLLMYQSGGSAIETAKRESAIQSPATESALNFYTSFSKPTSRTYSWNANLAPSLEAFARGEAAMAIGYARDATRIQALNPQLNFDVASMPQLKAEDANRVNYGRFSVFTVSRLSKNVEESWKFLLWLQGREPQKTYSDAVELPPARRELAVSQPPREYLTPFYRQTLSARTLPAAGGGRLTGIINVMIGAAVNRQLSVAQAISRADQEFNDLLRKR